MHESVPVAERLEYVLHPWSGYLVIPLFALANAGLAVDGSLLGDALASPGAWVCSSHASPASW